MQLLHRALVSLPVAWAATSASAYTAQSFEEKFDMFDDNFVPPGLDYGLQWNVNVELPIRDVQEDCYGVCANTFPADVGFNQTTIRSPTDFNITSIYKNSKVEFFGLRSFAFGCDSPVFQTYSGTTYQFPLPVNCTLTVHGKPAGNGAVRTFKADYVPQITKPRNPYPYKAAMTTVTAPASFGNVTTVWFTYKTHGGKEAPYPGTLYLDTFDYTTYNLTKKA